jgi:hypothetical protein
MCPQVPPPPVVLVQMRQHVHSVCHVRQRESSVAGNGGMHQVQLVGANTVWTVFFKEPVVERLINIKPVTYLTWLEFLV